MIEPLLLLLAGLLVILVIIAAGAYFVAQEFSYMAVDRTRLAAQAASGDAGAKRALAVTKRTSFMLSGAQLGITVTGLMVGYVAEPLVGQSLGLLLGGIGVPQTVGIAVGTTLTLVFATIVQMIFGELYPKNLAIADPEPMAKRLAASTQAYLKIFGWLITFFDKSANLFLRLLRIEPVHDLDVSASAEDLPHIIAESRESGDLPVELSLMMDRILDFPHRDVEHAMVPRAQADWIDPDTTIAEIQKMMATGHTRYPVINDDDVPVGVVHLADILPQINAGRPDAPATSVMRPVSIVPTLMPLPAALDTLVKSGNKMVCVIDEYGGFAGVLTIEDIAMEVVGEITDEFDKSAITPVQEEAENVWVMEGDVHLDEVERALNHDLPRGDFETIAGLLIAQLGRLPTKIETIRIDLPTEGADLVSDAPVRRWLEVNVLRIARHVPSLVRVKLVEETEQDQ
ncbi:HlyC/CorC family transporter [Xinfangfangia sp. D13-10-4-6]|uniref:hemolysin family protein n=1 Tax=Pseudogemmobacter hezensis TaxID=2737662 RepID=UPI001558213D|nr:hemolysin family protein [Pseudogemmobacter hezensis]NPD14929.1 HlyC/CorC family transporter [Pseudogemmobacter hezensis]